MQARRIATLVAGGVVVAAFAATAALATGSAPDTTVPKGQVVEDVVVRPTEVLPQNQDLVVQTTTVVPMPQQPAEQPVVPAPAPAQQAEPAPADDEPAPTTGQTVPYPVSPYDPISTETAPAPLPPEPECWITGPDGHLVRCP